MEIIQHQDQNNAVEQRYEKALLIDDRIKSGMLELYSNMAIMVDEKLYIELGYKNMNEYAAKLEIDRKTAYTYALIGRELNSINANLQSVGPARHLLPLGPSKLAEIVRHAREQLPRLVESGEIEIEGEVLSTEDIQKTTRKELREQLKLVKQAREEASAAKSELRIKSMEVDALQRELEDAKANKRNVTEEQEIHDCVTRGASKLHESLAEFQKIPRDAEFSDANKVEIVTQLNAAYDSIMFLRERYIALIEEFIAKS